MSYKGILTDYYLLSRGNDDQQKIYENVNRYLNVLAGHSLARWNSIVNGLDSLVSQLSYDNLVFKKSANRSNALSQFAIKEEAAGKIRVFALVDSISQSVLRPLHDHLFEILRLIPNDGTFDQEASVERSKVKAKTYTCAFSFDLSSATDRLPRSLTGSILEGLTGLDGFSSA